MRDEEKTKEQLIAENRELRHRVAALEASERRFRTIIDTVPLAIAEIDRQGIIVFANAATEKLFGYKPEELVGQRGGWDRTPDAREAFRAWFSQTMLEQPSPSPVFTRQINKNGERIDVRGDWNYLRNENDEVIGQVTVIADVTESKRATEALRQSEERYRALAESTRDVIFILNQQGTLLYANQAASQCIGIPVGDIVGKRQVDLFPPEMARSQIDKIERVFATGVVIEYDDLFHFGPAVVWLRIHLVPIRNESGQITSVMGVCHNITQRKLAEDALQKAHDDLEQRIKERTAELTAANAGLQREIEERKRGEAALQQSEERYRTLMDNIHSGITLMDSNLKS